MFGCELAREAQKSGNCGVTGHKEWKLTFCSDIELVDIYLFVAKINNIFQWETMSVQ